MADLVGCVKEIGKWILTQFVNFVYYWWCFDDNIKDLVSGIEELKLQKHDIEQKCEEARLLTNILGPRVEEWLEASTKKLEEAQNILVPNQNIPRAWNITSRYSMGKRAKETAEEIAKLLNDGKIAMGSPLHRPTVDFESRKSIEKNIIDSLKNSNVDMIGICGMGGVGKTIMAQRIGKRAKEENLFDEVAMVTVSQTMDLPKIQNEIAELLGLKFDVESIGARAYQLRKRLEDAKRKIIILDDVWKSPSFENLGIPIDCKFERCKVVLTSRSKDTFKSIKSKEVFDLKILEKEEAWILFKEKAGNCVEDSALRSVAEDVVKECKGLPLAIVTIGLALQDERSIHKWEDSLLQLRRGNPTDFEEVLTDVYNPLKLSYDYLNSDREKYLFLLCCLFPEDHNIPVEQLTWCSMGLRLFDDITNIKEIRNRTHSLVDKLKSRFLLIAGNDDLHVKMHDVVRDVAIYIGSRKNNGFLKSLQGYSIENPCDVNCNWMSVDISNEQMEVPVLSRFSKLRLLMLLKFSYDDFYDISHISFEGMEALNVLSFQSISIPSLPPTMGSLENLQTLRLFRCEVQNISVIGKLTSLTILSCCECKNITELPAEIGRLKGLLLLELNECRNLNRIPFGIISSLSLLEELKIFHSFSQWETGGERGNASLTELEGLLNLTCLEIHISDCTLSAQEILLSQKLVRYIIRIIPKEYSYSEDRDYEKGMILFLSGAVGNWIQLLARNAECLRLRGDGSDNINLAEMENLRKLEFEKCSTVKKLVDVSLCNLKSISISGCSNLKHVFSVSVATTRLLQLEILSIKYCESMEQVFWNENKDNNTYGCIEFPKLNQLHLRDLPNLTAFCQGLENIKFPNLKEMIIFYLPKLISLFCNPKDLLQLEVLHIEMCESMEQVFWNEIKDNNTYGCIEFPKLNQLRLRDLPNLTAFCQGLENIITYIEFPKLNRLYLQDLPNLTAFCQGLENIIIVKFPNLKEMFIERLPKLISLFCNLKDLLQLEVLWIRHCKSMKQIFWNEIKDNNTDGCIEFPKLKKLTLWNLSNLTAFCQGLIIVKFPNLGKMMIVTLPKLISLFCNPKDLLQLEDLSIENCESMEQVFWTEIKDNNTHGCIEFPKLRALYLLNMPNLTAFCQGLENIIIKFPNLREMIIGGLPKLISLSPPNSETVEKTCFHLFCKPKDLLQLEDLRIKNCESMEQVFWNEIKDNNTDGCIEFPKLKLLHLQNLPNLTAFCQGLENIIIKFPKLTKMRIGGLPKLISLSPPNSETVVRHDQNTCFHFFCNLKDLLQLEYLYIENCESMEQVFWNEIKDNNTDGCIEFPNLKELRLQNLPNLTAFCQGLENIIIKFPKLTQMYIGGLPKLISLCPPNSETVVRHDQNTCFHFFCNLKVEMFDLKFLELFGSKDTNIKKIWCSQISNNFFNNLKTLCISDMNDIRSLISTSIAKNLASLKILYIRDCKEMVEVIETDDDNDKQADDINCLFPKLESLKITGMPKLKRFWQWNHALELPLLEKMKIYNCPVMETFTLGSVNTPNIRKISVNFKNIEDHKDLNDVICNIWTECHMSKAEEDEDEDKVESKDEYNNDNVTRTRRTMRGSEIKIDIMLKTMKWEDHERK